ncbi:MAG: tetratricopeptide repeat protein [Candidatus Hodarchaeota archaeon]
MIDLELKGNQKSKELKYAEHLINETKFAEAYQVLTEFGENQKVPIYHRVLGSLLQCRISMWQGNYLDCYKIAERIYKESLGLEKNLIMVEALGIMSLSLIILREFNKGIEMVQQAENLLKTFPRENSPRYPLIEALIAQNKGYYHIWSIKNIEVGLRYLEESLSLRKRYGGKVEIAMSYLGVGSVLSQSKGKLNDAIEYLKQGLTIANESGNKWPVIMILRILGNSYFLRGELDRAIEYYKNGLEVAKEVDNKDLMINFLIGIGEYYSEKGELDLALEHLGQGIALCEEFRDKRNMIFLLGSAIEISLLKDDYERAQEFFIRLKQLSVQFNDKKINIMLLYYNALLLKTSSRFRNKIKAEEKLRQILEMENLPYTFEVSALIHLSELLLTELRVTNEVEVLQEIKPLITQLLEVAENSNSYWVLCEAYLLKAKIALLELDIKTARRLLIQATQIAKRYDLKQLIKKLNVENEELNDKLGLWEQLKEVNAPLAERLDLIRLDQQIAGMIQIRTKLTAQVKEEEVVIHKEKRICLVCRGEVLKYSYICDCGAMYCESCAHALTDLENVCWVCNIPIDHLKPIKVYKEGEKTKINGKKKSK